MSCQNCSHGPDELPAAIAQAERHARLLLTIEVAAALTVTIIAFIITPVKAMPVLLGWGLLTYAAATSLGTMVGTWVRRGRDLSQTSVAMRVRIASAIAAATVLVISALVVAARSEGRWVGGLAPQGPRISGVAVCVVAGWLLAAGVLAVIQTVSWFALLRSQGDAGELIRSGIAHTTPNLPWSLLTYFLAPVMLGVWIVALAWLPWLIIVAIPAQIMLTLLLVKRV